MSNITEEWRDVTGLIGWYEVSNLGRVRRTETGRTLKQRLHHGYPVVCLRMRDKSIYPFIHRLVAEAFIGERQEGMQVNHRNGIKIDNRPENLEYCTPSENRKHAYATGLQSMRGEDHTQAKLSEFLIRVARRCVEFGMTQRSFADVVGVRQSSISRALSGARWPHLKGDILCRG